MPQTLDQSPVQTSLDPSLIEQAVEACSLSGVPAPHRSRALIEIGDVRFGVEITHTGVRHLADVGINASWDFSIYLSREVWETFCSPVPPRGFTSLGAIVATQGAERIGGDRAAWARATLVLDRILESLRDRVAGKRMPTAKAPPTRKGFSPIEGRYITIDVGDSSRRIYFEAAGKGTPIICLHTAGSDSRQYRHLLEDPELTSRYRLYAFDLPWHGRSDPPDDWEQQRYTLTTQVYADTVLAFMDALELERPILTGCSIGGAICLYMASVHGDKFAGVCALEGGLGNPGRFVEWTNRLDVDHSSFMVSWERGLMAPSSPAGPRAQTLWQYAQGGPGIYQGDTHFYSIDLPKHAASLKSAKCPLYILTGEYDYSATVEMSQQAAKQLGGEMVVMRGRGHFPMSEDPIGTSEYLYPAFDAIVAKQKEKRG